jgi:hypothetical protein
VRAVLPAPPAAVRPPAAGIRILAAILLAAASGCASGSPLPGARGASAPAEASVRVSWKDAPLPGARVEWRADLSPDFPREGPVSTSDARGIASARIPPGRWFLSAQWRADGDYARPLSPGDRFAWFGSNPVRFPPGSSTEIFLSLAEVSPPPAARGGEGESGGVAGVVLSDGAPIADARVYAYLRTDTAFRDPGLAASGPTGPDGAFFLDLPPGRYWLVARKRAGGGTAGPLRKGDSFGYFPGNPVEVPGGAPARVSIPVTTLRLRNAPSWSVDARSPASIEGRILGTDGRPRRGVYAAIYDNPDLLNRPVSLSDVTGEDGRYRLAVPFPGTWYLGARSGYGGSPAPGDYYGRYEGNAEHAVTVRRDERLTGVDVTVSEVR